MSLEEAQAQLQEAMAEVASQPTTPSSLPIPNAPTIPPPASLSSSTKPSTSIPSCQTSGSDPRVNFNPAHCEDPPDANTPTTTTTAQADDLRAEVAELTRLLTDLAVEERDAQTQLQSLKYAVQLTRGEVERRQRANTELETAYHHDGESLFLSVMNPTTPTTTSIETLTTPTSTTTTTTSATNVVSPVASLADAELDEVQRLEGALLNLKRDVASVLFETEALELQVRQQRDALREQPSPPGAPTADGAQAPPSPSTESLACGVGEGVSGIGVMAIQEAVVSPQNRAGVLSVSSPHHASGGGVGTRKASPPARAVRLIGDVDALVAFGPSNREARFAPCRLGVSATGQLGVYSYASAAPLLPVAETSAEVRDVLPGAEMDALREGVVVAPVGVGGAQLLLCGLREAVAAALVLVRDGATDAENGRGLGRFGEGIAE